MNTDMRTQALSKLKESRQFFKKLPKSKSKKVLDEAAHKAHFIAESETDCLTCANCCKTVGPLFTPADIERLSRVFGMKNSEFREQYLRQDEDKDYVLSQTPCPFLLSDNRCLIYDDRPKACREYPHTDRKNLYQIRQLTLANTLVCPIAYRVVERLKEVLS